MWPNGVGLFGLQWRMNIPYSKVRDGT
uniref:Uncharacterized protein n=1 Tax=Rhizophora mucronata TaxID=61149 RepID=A0A2P2NZH8_RHIMU